MSIVDILIIIVNLSVVVVVVAISIVPVVFIIDIVLDTDKNLAEAGLLLR
jgi:hypothetical protein